jgi:hypothetical protein
VSQEESEVRGVYTLTTSDLQTINEIEETKNYFLMNIDIMNPREAHETFVNLLTSMKIFMESYKFNDYLQKSKVDGFNFYYVKDTAPLIQGDIELLRKGSEIAFTIWKQVLIILGVELPTTFFRSQKENDTQLIQSDRYRFKVY